MKFSILSTLFFAATMVSATTLASPAQSEVDVPTLVVPPGVNADNNFTEHKWRHKKGAAGKSYENSMMAMVGALVVVGAMMNVVF